MKHIKSILIAAALILASIASYYAKYSSQLVYVDVNKLIKNNYPNS